MSGRNTNPDVYIIHCDYEEGRPETYRGTYVMCERIRFNFNITGNPWDDYNSALDWIVKDMHGLAMNSSDVDTFQLEVQEDGCFFI